jgi:hypothetical protein
MPIFRFGCFDIRNPNWILSLNTKCCLDGQCEELYLYETKIIILIYTCNFFLLVYLILSHKIRKEQQMISEIVIAVYSHIHKRV